MKIITVIGARPQFVKSAMVSKALAKHQGVNEIIVHTGQHFDQNMSDVFFEDFGLKAPAYNLGVHSLMHGAMTGKMLLSLEPILLEEKPDLVLVYGDTNSTLAGALTAKKLNIKVAHVEAGLRSYNATMPEEINRVLVDRMSDILFCPTTAAIDNLHKEGFDTHTSKIVMCGDVMQDAALYFGKLALEKSKIFKALNVENYVLATIHRAENTDNYAQLKSIVDALNEIHQKISVVMPIHPRTKYLMDEYQIKPVFKIIDPQGYIDMLALIQHSSLLVTDSGGLQKEAYFFRKNCVTLRNETEWIELVDMGYNMLAGSETQRICNACNIMLNKQQSFRSDLYGTGISAEQIASYLLLNV
ncbi:MAG: non-hydrolyzing UDP-N-acetylglucosamine 2-epimerase [Bacteroidota bacterium]